MQAKKLSALCALAYAAMAGQCHAAMTAGEQAIVNDANTNGRVIFISGASAVQKGFTGIISTLFQGTPIRFANTTASNKDYEAFAGKLMIDTYMGDWRGQNVIIIYRVKGGSVWGVNPVARATAIESLNVTSAPPACGGQGSGTAASPYTCTLGNRVPDAGVSAVAPALFQSPINSEGEIPADALTPEEQALLTSFPIYGLAFGVSVTNTVSSNLTLNRAAVAAIMAGNLGTWDKVDPVNNPTTDDIVVCRRVPGSGTQAVFNMYFGNYPCRDQYNVPADRDASAAWDDASNTYTVTPRTGGLVVIENSTSGDVRTCLDKAVTGGTYVTKDRDGAAVTVNFTAAGNKAIGVLSMDSLSSSKTTGNWQFRSLDGAGKIVWDNTTGAVSDTGSGKFPTLASYVDGTWDLQGWISLNMPDRLSPAKQAVLFELGNRRGRYSSGSVGVDPDILNGIPDLTNVAVALPSPFSNHRDCYHCLRAGFFDGNQCAPYNRDK